MKTRRALETRRIGFRVTCLACTDQMRPVPGMMSRSGGSLRSFVDRDVRIDERHVRAVVGRDLRGRIVPIVVQMMIASAEREQADDRNSCESDVGKGTHERYPFWPMPKIDETTEINIHLLYLLSS
jgi:hypothetical protein